MKPTKSNQFIRELPALRRRVTRAEFFRSLGRYALLGAMAGGAALLAFRRRREAGPAGEEKGCGYDLACRQCAELPGCPLARAARARQAIRSGR